MKKLFCFACALVLICTSYALGQDVAVFYDEAVENGGGLAVPNPSLRSTQNLFQTVSRPQKR